ncbi:type II toxin-antitoxin system RelB/DinJ family antitoxin [Bifidobacterium crudilactis]|jgi:addiction module RelB/DinJ family antitoxin|uniref:type II toxin-antitoxin system RelB/DinJ family antitoxin n=1 Tax=Bifidobacterium crudilactis TaxID=327277 RepID=UPI002F35A4AB|nr:type II toxin-antitoxin system RelB/DinJ family antitoxin [Bifidobacterium crudilactis]
MSTVQIGIRIDEQEKREFEETATALGISPTAAIKMFIAKFIRDKGINFPVTLNDEVRLPEEVEKAMIIAKAEEYGLLPDTSETVSDISSLRSRWE